MLHTGFIVDDYAQLSMMAGTYPVSRSPLALFTFTNGEPTETQTLKDVGYFPWWTHPALKISLFRPLASALMWVDRAMFGDDAWLFHLHSAAWWLAMSITWGLLALRFLPGPWGLLVHALCALHPANGILLSWIANRNASVAMFFGLLGLLVQVTRRERSAPASSSSQVLIAACWGLSLLAGEYGAGMLVFCVLYELISPRPTEAEWTLVKTGLTLVVAYGLLRSGFGFGSRKSGMYVDPSAEPLAFLGAALHRGPVLVADLVLGFRSNWWSAGYPWSRSLAETLQLSDDWMMDLRPMRRVHEIAGLIAIVLGALIAWFGQRQNSKLRFAALGLPLAIVPTLGGTPESRLLLPAMFGWSLLQVQSIEALVQNWRKQKQLGIALALLSFCVLTTVETKASFDYSAQERDLVPRTSHAIRAAILAPTLEQRLARVEDAFLVAGVDPTTTIYIPMLRRWHHHSGPLRCHLLLSTVAAMRLDRLSDNTFRLSRYHHYYTPPDVYAEAFRREPLQVGQTFEMQTFQASVEEVQDGMPTVVRFQATRNLDDPSIALLTQGTSGLQLVPFPPVGASITIAPANFPFELMSTGAE